MREDKIDDNQFITEIERQVGELKQKPIYPIDSVYVEKLKCALIQVAIEQKRTKVESSLEDTSKQDVLRRILPTFNDFCLFCSKYEFSVEDVIGLLDELDYAYRSSEIEINNIFLLLQQSTPFQFSMDLYLLIMPCPPMKRKLCESADNILQLLNMKFSNGGTIPAYQIREVFDLVEGLKWKTSDVDTQTKIIKAATPTLQHFADAAESFELEENSSKFSELK